MTDRLGWHFVRSGRTLRYNDSRKVLDGETLYVLDTHRPIALCEYGMHASPTILDALRYAPGSTLCRVSVLYVQATEQDKFVGTARTCHETHDVREQLVAFAQWCAERAYAAYAARAAAANAAAVYATDAAVYAAANAAAANAAQLAERAAQNVWLDEHIGSMFKAVDI